MSLMRYTFIVIRVGYRTRKNFVVIRPQPKHTYRERRVSWRQIGVEIRPFLTSAMNRGQWSASGRDRFYPRGNKSCTQ